MFPQITKQRISKYDQHRKQKKLKGEHMIHAKKTFLIEPIIIKVHKEKYYIR